MEPAFHGVLVPIACVFSSSLQNKWISDEPQNQVCLDTKTHTACAFTNIPAAFPAVTNWQETHSFQTMCRLPPMWHLAVQRRCHLYPIHHNIAQSFVSICLGCNLFLIYGFLNAWKACLGGWASCLGVCCKVQCSVPPVKDVVGASTELLSAVRSSTLVEAHRQHTQPPSLFTNLSQESKPAVSNRRCCQERRATASQIKPKSGGKIQRSAEGGEEA